MAAKFLRRAGSVAWLCMAGLALAIPGWSQGYRPPIITAPIAPTDQTPNAANPNQHLRLKRDTQPPPGYFNVDAVSQEVVGSRRHLRGRVRLESETMLLTADEVDYDEDTEDAEARGHVRFENYVTGDKLECDHAKYNLDREEGTFWEVSGTSPAKIQARPGILTTSNPFYFEGKWAERVEDKYILHDGYITDCRVPKPWWRLVGTKFDIYPEDHAIAYHTTFRLRGFPLFYAPALYKSLKKEPRKSGFLTPNIGHSSLRGYMFGLGYYWAINRSYDAMYRAQIFSQGAVAHTVDFRGKVRPGTDFNLSVYAVNNSGVTFGSAVNSAGVTVPLTPSGALVTFDVRSDLGNGWQARGQLNYLSSFLFRQDFTESFHEAIYSESHSIGYVTKHWDNYGFFVQADRDLEYETVDPKDTIALHKVPEVDFLGREQQIVGGPVPLFFRFDSSAGLYNRTEPEYQTRKFVDRLDVHPILSTAFSFAGFHLIPSFGFQETQYGSRLVNGLPNGRNLVRSDREFNVELVAPPLFKIYKAPKWMNVEKLKHVIEARAVYKYVDGIGTNFLNVIRFDDLDLMSNTNELQYSLTNRLYTKDKNGNVNEILTWELSQAQYFDPTFGGAVVTGQRNVVQSVADLTGYSFLNGPRSYSPVVSRLRYQQKVGLEWRTDYDPKRGEITNSTLSVDYRINQYVISAGHNQVHTDPVLAPSSNQFRTLVGYGNDQRRGWNAAYSLYYDYKRGLVAYSIAQVVYNTDCCGISFQYRRFNIGTRDESQYRVAFAVSNIGTFGTLKKQERIF